MDNKLSGKYNFTSLLKFALPTMIMMVFFETYTVADGVIVSRLISTNALSAINIVYPIANVISAIAIMLAAGGSALVARKMGECKPHEARQDFTLITVVGVVIGLFITIMGLIFINPILRFLGADDTLYQLCYDYGFYTLLFAIPSILQMLFQSFFVAAGRSALGLTVVILGGITNVVLDIVFIQIFGLGIAGAAIATGIGYSIPAVVGFVWFTTKRKEILRFARPVWRKAVLLKSITNGSSEMVTQLSVAITTFMFNIAMMNRVGVDGVAAITIVLYAEYLFTAIYLGYCNGIAPIVSYSHGERNVAQLRRLFKISVVFLSVSSLVIFLGAFLFARPVTSIFAPVGSAVYELAVHGFYLFALSYLLKGINIYASSLFTALSNGKTSAFLSFMRTLVFIVVGIAFLPRIIGIDGIWLAVPFAEVLSLVLSLYCFRKLFQEQWCV